EGTGDPQLCVRRPGEPHGGEPPDDAERYRRDRLGPEGPRGNHDRARDQHAGRGEPAGGGGGGRAGQGERGEAPDPRQGRRHPSPCRTVHLTDSRTPGRPKNKDLDRSLTRRSAVLTPPLRLRRTAALSVLEVVSARVTCEPARPPTQALRSVA